jgi:hypothetical protein
MPEPLFTCRSEIIWLWAFLTWDFRRNKGIVIRCDQFEEKSKWRFDQYVRTFGFVTENGYNKIVKNISIW